MAQGLCWPPPAQRHCLLVTAHPSPRPADEPGDPSQAGAAQSHLQRPGAPPQERPCHLGVGAEQP